jgi:hypothetical protein
VAIECDHPRPPLDLPGYVPHRPGWQVPSYIPDLPPNAARVVREALQGVYQELSRLGQTRNVIPLYEDVFARPGSVIQGVGNGQTITLAQPGAQGYLDPVSLLLTDVTSPVNVVHPDGTVTTIGSAGSYDFTPAGEDAYETDSAAAILAGAVPTDKLLGRDTAGTGAVEFIGVTAPIEFDGAGNIRIATNGIGNSLIRQSAGLSVLGRAAATTGDIADITSGPTTDGQALYLRTNAAGTLLAWQTMSEASMPRITDGFFFANMSGVSPGQVLAKSLANMAGPGLTFSTANVGDYKFVVNGSTSIVIGTDAGTDDVQRAALTGDVTAAQNSNATTIAASAVTNAKLADMAQSTVKGRAEGAGTGAPVDLTPTQVIAIVDAENVAWTGNHSFTSSTFDANIANDLRLGATSGVGFYAGAAATPGAVATGHVMVNATAGFGVLVDTTPAAVSSGGAGFVTFSATSDMWMSTTAGGIELNTLNAGHPTGVTNGQITLNAQAAIHATALVDSTLTAPRWNIQSNVGTLTIGGATAFQFTAASSFNCNAGTSFIVQTGNPLVERLEIENDGAWQLGGASGTAGQVLVTAGSAAPPVWGQVGLNGLPSIADDTFLANIAGSTTTPTAVALTTLAGAGLTGGADAILNVGAGTGITVNANDIAVTIPLTDGDKGDITVASSGTSWTVDTNISKAWTGVHSFTSSTFTVTTSGLASISGDDVTLAGTDDVIITAGDDLSLVSTNDNILLTATGATGDIIATANTTIIGTANTGNVSWNATVGDILLTSGDDVINTAGNNFRVLTAAVSRLVIEADGSWNIGGSNGTSGHPLVSAGSAAPPAWGQLPTVGIADAAVTLAKQANLAQSTIIGRAEGAGTGVPQALTPTQVIAIVDGESPTWTASHRFDSFIQFGTSTSLPATGDIRKTSTLLINAGADVDLLAGDDVNITATDAVSIQGTGTTTVSGTTAVSITSSNNIGANAGGALTLTSAGTATVSSGAGIVLVASSGILVNPGSGSLVEISEGIRRTGVLLNATNGTINDLAIGSAGTVRFSAADVLTGMVPQTNWHEVLLINANASDDLRVDFEDIDSSASNRFAGFGTSRIIKARDVAFAVYDGTSSRWRLLVYPQ